MPLRGACDSTSPLPGKLKNTTLLLLHCAGLQSLDVGQGRGCGQRKKHVSFYSMVCSALDIKRASPSSGCAASRAEAGGSSCWGNAKLFLMRGCFVPDSRGRDFTSELVTCHTGKKLSSVISWTTAFVYNIWGGRVCRARSGNIFVLSASVERKTN